MRPRAPLFSCTLSLLLSLLAACSNNNTTTLPPCNENPWECPSGQTCWPSTSSTFDCLTVGNGAPGSTCLNVVGIPSCVAGYSCYQAAGTSKGTCVAFCDNKSHGCAGGTSCITATLGGPSGPSFDVCGPGAGD